MVLLIPKTVRWIMHKGHAEGRKEERMRMISALRSARVQGIDPDRPEFEQFLLGFDADKSDCLRQQNRRRVSGAYHASIPLLNRRCTAR